MRYRKYNSYNNDPHWLNARFSSKCCKCGKAIKKGERIFYYPIGKHVYCTAITCGETASNDFQSHACDEAFYNGYGDPFAS